MTSGGHMSGLCHPVDKGWAWMIALSAFVVQCMSLGYQRSFGMLFVAFQEKYGSSSTATAFITGAQTATYCFFTLIVMNVVLTRYSVRASCILGCLFQVTAVSVTCLVPDTGFLIFTQGVLYGCGHALIYCPTLLIVSQYFERRRPIATTLASCGGSLGGALFPVLTKHLLGEYGLEGALVVLSGMLLQQLPLIFLYTPPSDYRPPPSSSVTQTPIHQNGSVFSSDSCEKNSGKYESVVSNNTSDLTTRLLVDEYCQAELTEVPEPLTNELPRGKNHNGVPTNLGAALAYHNGVPANQDAALAYHNGAPANQDAALALITRSDTFLSVGITEPQYWRRSHHQLSTSSSKKGWSISAISASAIDKIACSRPDLQLNGRTTSVPEKSPVLNGVVPEDTSTVNNSPISGQTQTTRCCQVPHMLKSRPFWILGIFMMTGAVGTGHPAVFIPPLAKERGLSTQDAAFFLMLSSVVGMFGRLVPGIVLQLNIMKASTVLVVPLMLCATAYHMTPFLVDFESILALTLAYGLLSSSFWALQTLVVIEILGMENLAPATGFYSVFMGVAGSISFPLGGALKDITGTYSSTFHFYGVMYLIAAACLLLVRWGMRKHSKSIQECDTEISKSI